MPGEATNIDTLQIQVKADAKKASTSLDALRKSLVSLGDAISGGSFEGLKSLANALGKLAEGTGHVKAFAGAIRSMGKAMDGSTASMTRFQSAMMDTAMIAGTAAGQMRDMNVQEFLSNTSQQTITEQTAAMQALTKSVDELAGKMSSAGNKVKDFGKTAEKAKKQTSLLATGFKELSEPISNLVASFKRIAFYRFIRTVLKGITSAVKEGLTNLKAYSDTVGTAFAPAVDDLSRHVLLLKNSFATALRPAIEAVIPFVIQLADAFSRLADFIAQVTSVLFGKTDENGRYTKAVLGDLQKGNKEAKKLQRTLLGFDEINRLDGDTGSGTSDSANLDFVQADVSEQAKGVADFIKNIDWQKVAEYAGMIAGVLATIKGVKILGGLKNVWDVIKKIWSVLKKVGGWIASAAKALGVGGTIAVAVVAVFALWGDKIDEFMEKAQKKVGGVFDWIDDKLKFSKGLTAISQFQRTIFNLLTETIGTAASMVYKLVRGDFKGALKELIHLIATLLKGAISLVVGFVNIILGFVDDIIYYVMIAAQWVYNHAIVPVVNWFATGIEKIRVWIHNAWIDIQVGLLTAFKWIIEKINVLLGALESAVNKAIDAWNKVTGSNVGHVDLTINTDQFDAKIDELKNAKLPPVTETVQLLTEWKDPVKRLNLQIDATGVYSTIDKIEKKLQNVIDGAANRAKKIAPTNSMYTNTISAYASGGFPTAGSLFIAGEGGGSPEYVGSFGGQTGVWNSDQLVSAMFSAFSSALAANPQGGGDIYLDGEVIYKNTVRRNNNQVRSTGRSALLT